MTAFNKDPLQYAADFVNRTSRNIFLTGKAGTGKTTFLRDLAKKTHKEFIIVAPTGIAALNAQGVTIHSQFLLPFGSFIPDPNYRLSPQLEQGFYTREVLFKRHTLNSVRKKVLQSLELLIIDEVSMLRADVLDAIDVRLRWAKNNYKRPFGGVQVLFIGDLFQLPPIVSDSQRGVLGKFYESQHFFHSHAIKQSGLIYVELQKIFRQTDDVFISILNNLRQNKITESDREILNQHYQPDAEPEKGVITLATHNKQVDSINTKSLEELESESFTYVAEVDGDFPEGMYPCESSLELKVGAQVMFVKNDSSLEKRYYNGKLAEVVELDYDEITVVLEGETETYRVPTEKWENSKYSVGDEALSPELEVVGSFTQFPLKLAWAVTVHKSQGLTFDKAIIDVGKAFAPGQVYVALSRLRSMDGLRLKTPIPSSSVQNDPNVVRFSESKAGSEVLEEALNRGEELYLQELVLGAFLLTDLLKAKERTIDRWQKPLAFNVERIQQWPQQWSDEFERVVKTSQTFQAQLHRLVNEQEKQQLFERLKKGTEYFSEELRKLLDSLIAMQADLGRLKSTNTLRKELDEMELALLAKWRKMSEVSAKSKALLTQEPLLKDTGIEKSIRHWREMKYHQEKDRAQSDPQLKKGKRKRSGVKGVTSSKESTFEITFKLYKEGKSIADIAKARDLTEATVVGHLARGISQDVVDVHSFIDADMLNKMEKTYHGQTTLSEWREDVDKVYSFLQLRLAKAHFDKTLSK